MRITQICLADDTAIFPREDRNIGMQSAVAPAIQERIPAYAAVLSFNFKEPIGNGLSKLDLAPPKSTFTLHVSYTLDFSFFNSYLLTYDNPKNNRSP